MRATWHEESRFGGEFPAFIDLQFANGLLMQRVSVSVAQPWHQFEIRGPLPEWEGGGRVPAFGGARDASAS